jgi:DNA-directed RNA polymerase specialized sigma24 family protein
MTASLDGGLLLSRHEADLATVEHMRVVGFHGPIFEWFVSDLYRYAWPVMLHAIHTGTIASIETGIPHSTISAEERQLLHDSSPEREDLALASIARALPKFVRSLRLGLWDPSKGRSLRSFFVCACARAFWHEYELWSAQRRRHLQAIAGLANSKSTDAELVESFDEHHERRQAVELLLAKAEKKSPELRAILQCLFSGMTAAEAASRLGYTERAVEGRLYQFRKTAWGLVQSGRIDPSLVPGSRARLARERTGADL